MTEAGNTKRRQLVVGNWKMNGSKRENAELLAGILTGWTNDIAAEVVVCPAFPYLAQAGEIISGSALKLGAQNLAVEQKGAYTGEVSAQMLADLDCKFVIIGHNERRRLQGETDAQVAQKFLAAQAQGLTPIVCVGESLEKRESGDYLAVIESQLAAVLNQVGLSAFANAVVAYEPVWAVGTGKTAKPEQAEEVHKFIRSKLGALAQSVRILYGGSVKAGNAAELFALADLDGALLGGASLDADEFLTICKCAN